jgi:tetratricopeptide (TPR) repeat protein
MCLARAASWSTPRTVVFCATACVLAVVLAACAQPVVVMSHDIYRDYRATNQASSDPATRIAWRCHNLVQARQYVAAVDACDVAIGLRPGNPDLYLARSAAYLGLRLAIPAETDAATAIRLNPWSSGAYNNHGLALMQRGFIGQALADFGQSLRLDPNNVNARLNIGFVYRRQGMHLESLEAFERVIQIAPGRSDGYRGRGTTLIRLGRTQEALADLEMAVRLAPESPEALNDRGWVRERAGLLEAARADYAAALALRPGAEPTLSNYRRVLGLLQQAPQPAELPRTVTPQPEPVQPPPAPDPAPPAPEPAPALPAPSQLQPALPPVPPSVTSPPAPEAEPDFLDTPEPLPPSRTGMITTGSGIVLGDGQWVATNHHVIATAAQVLVRNGGGHVRQARVLAVSEADDLALLRIESPFPGTLAVPLDMLADPMPGREIVVLGFPRIDVYGSARPNLTTGLVAKAEGLRDDPASFQTTAPVRPGNSGGPIFDLNGRLLGVISARLLTDAHNAPAVDAGAALSIGVKSGRILRLLGAPPAMPPQSPFATQTAEAIYNRMLHSTVLVAAYP